MFRNACKLSFQLVNCIYGLTSEWTDQLFQWYRPLWRPWSRTLLTVSSWSEPADPALWLEPGSELSHPAPEHSEENNHTESERSGGRKGQTKNSRMILKFVPTPVWRRGCAGWQVQHTQQSFQIRSGLEPEDLFPPVPKGWPSPGSEWAGTNPDLQPPASW